MVGYVFVASVGAGSVYINQKMTKDQMGPLHEVSERFISLISLPNYAQN
jgi:hypothetical protein